MGADLVFRQGRATKVLDDQRQDRDGADCRVLPQFLETRTTTAIESVVHITMPANDLMRHTHNAGNNPHRMPAILDQADTEAWLTGSNDDAFACLKPYPAGMMAAWEVTRAVNSPKNNVAELIEPVATTPQPSVKTDDGQSSLDLPLLDPGEQPIDE